MKKYILIFSPIIVTIAVCAVLLIASSKNASEQTLPFSVTTPTPVAQPESPNQQENPLSLVQTSPNDHSTNVLGNTSISFTFNRRVLQNELAFSSLPSLLFSVRMNGKTVTLTPNQPLNQNTTYYFFAQVNNNPQTFSFAFTTVSNQPTVFPPVTGTYFGSEPDTTAQTEDQLALKEHPDIYLYNRCPYNGSDFSVTSGFADTDTPHYFFDITLTGIDRNAAKNDFIIWLQTLGLTTQQINVLDIRYQ